MALVKCRECGRDVSTKAKVCPACGASPKSYGIGWLGTFTGLVIVLLFVRCAFSGEPSASSSAASAPNAPGKPASAALDYSRAIVTDRYAVVCPQWILFDRRAKYSADAIYDAFHTIWGRSEKVEAAGCEEWNAGVPVYFARRMRGAFDYFIEFSATPSGRAEYFTMQPFLKNVEPVQTVTQTNPAESKPVNVPAQPDPPAQAAPIAAPTVEQMSEAEFSAQFQCPETYATEDDARHGFVESMTWYRAHHTEVIEAEFKNFRRKLLESHSCDKTLAGMGASAPGN